MSLILAETEMILLRQCVDKALRDVDNSDIVGKHLLSTMLLSLLSKLPVPQGQEPPKIDPDKLLGLGKEIRDFMKRSNEDKPLNP